MHLHFSKMRDVKSPTRAHSTDAGIDFYIPNDFPALTLEQGESALIPSGIKVEIPFGYAGIFMNKSGVASKKGLLVGAQVIDTYYDGEVHINIHNVRNFKTTISPGDKIIQLIIFPIVPCAITEVDEKDLYSNFKTEYRGINGFGSSDKK